MICFGANSSTALAQRRGHASGNMASQAILNTRKKHVVSECHAADGMAVRMSLAEGCPMSCACEGVGYVALALDGGDVGV